MSARGSLSLLKFLFDAGVIILALLTLLALILLPDLIRLKEINPGRTALMWQRSGAVVQNWVPLSRISSNLQQAVLTGEDLNFYGHYGIDFYELQQSMKKNWKEKRWARGASTITMQLVKNLYLSTRKIPTRKLVELVITLEMEQILPKARILEIYLNVIEWGPHIYGAEAAARHYFDKSAGALTAVEAAYLAAIIPNPRVYSNPRYSRYAERRKNWILYRMVRPEGPLRGRLDPALPVEGATRAPTIEEPTPPPELPETIENGEAEPIPEPLPPDEAEPVSDTEEMTTSPEADKEAEP